MDKFVRDLEDGEYATIPLVVRKKYGIREYKNKFGKFFVIEAGDKTGNLLVKYWGRDDELTKEMYNELDEGKIIEVSGTFQKENPPYISVDADYDNIKILEEYDKFRFIPSADNIDTIMNEIMKIVEGVENPYLSKLLDHFFSDNNFVEEFKLAPGSSYDVYSYLGGLAEHTLNVAKICERLSGIYNVDKDLVITASLLHDIGKIESYEIDTTIKIRNEGKLIGHTLMSYRIVEEKIKEIIDFPQDLRDKLLHAIIAHHSPIVDNVPQRIRTREAYLLFYANMIDLSLKEFEMESEEEWMYSKKMGREIYIG